MRMHGNFARGLLALALTATAAATAVAAQATAPKATDHPKALFEQARLAEESEHDFVRAAQLFERLGGDETLDSELRAKSWLQASRNLERLGKHDKARTALQLAAALGGETGAQAQRLLDHGNLDERVMQRVDAAISNLRLAMTNGVPPEFSLEKPPFLDVYWLGKATLPGLETLVATFADQTPLMAAVMRLIVAIGGEEAAAQVRQIAASPDVVLRRTLLESAQEKSDEEPVRSALLLLCADADPRMRELALRKLMGLMSEGELLAHAHDPDEQTRARVIELAWRLAERDPATKQRGVSPTLLAAVRASFEDPSLAVRKAVCSVLKETLLFRSAEGRELWLEALQSQSLNDPELREASWRSRGVREKDWNWDRVPAAATLLAAARAVFAGDAPDGVTAKQGFREFFAACLETTGTGDPWPEDHASLVTIAQLGGFETFAGWVRAHARIDDLPGLLEAAIQGVAGSLAVLEPLITSAPELPADAQRRCVDALVRRFEALLATGEVNPARVYCLWALLKLGLPAGDRALVGLLGRSPRDYAVGVRELLRRKSPAASDAVLLDLLTLPALIEAPRPGEQPAEDPAGTRSLVVIELAERRAAELPQRMAAAYRAGLAKATGADGFNLGNLGPLVCNSTASGYPPQWAPRYDVATLEQVLTECAAVGAPEFWHDLQYLPSFFDRNAPATDDRARLSRAFGKVLVGIATTQNWDLIERRVSLYVGGECPGWEEFVVAGIELEPLADSIVENLPAMPAALLPKVLARASRLSQQAQSRLPYALLASEDPAVRMQVVALLHHEAATLRGRAVYFMVASYPTQLLDAAPALVRDPDSEVRLNLAMALGRIFDRAAIPLLVELLRDGDAKTREAARASLDALQYYFESAQKWERLKAGTSLDATSAAEALVKQARSGATIELRKAAIESLGTLKVPETLPFLLELMADPDPTLAAAAKAAITKING